MSKKPLQVAAVLLLAWLAPHTVLAGPAECRAAVEAEYAPRTLAECRQAAESGDARSQFILGALYERGLGVPADYAEASRWYRKSAEQGDHDAQMFLAGPLRFKLEDDAEAAHWYRLAAERGDIEAQLTIGYLYERGDGVLQDYAEAVAWYRIAAEQRDARGQNAPSFMYEFARGVPQNYVLAHMWRSLAAAQDPSKGDATLRDGLATTKMTPEEIAEAEALSRVWTPE